MLDGLATDLADFTAFDPDLSEDKTSALQQLYTDTLAEGGDDVEKGKVGVKTQALNNSMDKCQELVTSLRYWVKKAYKDDPASQKRYRLKQYWCWLIGQYLFLDHPVKTKF